jgi:hypothetical protein
MIRRRGFLSSRIGKVIFVLAFVAAVVLLTFFRPGSRPERVPAPKAVWSMDLYADSDFQKRKNIEEVSLYPPFIHFLNDSQLICDFYNSEIGGFDLSTPLDYHVLEIDVHNGAPGRKLDFQAVDDKSRALPVADGGFVVFTGKELRHFTNTFVPGASYSTPREQSGVNLDHLFADVSPTGRTVLLYHHRPEELQSQWTWLNTTDFSILKSIRGPFTRTVQASDAAAIFGGINDSRLLSEGQETVICTGCNSHFLTNDLMFLDEEHWYSIKSTAGKKLGTGNLDIEASNFARAASATRFAYATGHYVGSGFPIQTKFESLTGKVMVVDWATNKPVAEIDINEPAGNPSAGLRQMAFALSPDGKLLAVILHHTLTLYSLP